METPVYLFTGFLESGKTRFIQETMEDERFDTGEETLILVCEEGIEEYAPEKFCSKNVFIEMIENESDITQKLLIDLQKKHRAKRILVEYNGMWQLRTLFDSLPDDWVVVQEFMFADAATFLNYNKNMRSLVAEKISDCELIVFNRYTANIDKLELHKTVRALNTRTTIAYEYTDGSVEYDEIEDPLPFDKNADIITVEDKDYAYFYRDLSEHLDSYNKKTVCFKCVVAKNHQLKQNELVVGRHIITCCVEDITFAGLVLKGNDFSYVKNTEWVIITAQIKIENNNVYGRTGPVLYCKDLKITTPPKTEAATFY